MVRRHLLCLPSLAHANPHMCIPCTRLPFYYLLKTIFLLYLALPQTAGSAWLYQTQLRPFFSAHENQIDTALAQLKAYLYTSLQRLLRRGWEQVSGAVSQAPTQPAGSSLLEEDAATHTGAPPSTHDPVSGPAQLVAGLWSTYGPGLLASGAALLTQAQASAAQAAANANVSAQAGRSRGRRSQEGEEAGGYDVSSATSSPAFVPVSMPSPSGSNGKSAFEEVDVPSDMEMDGHPVSPRQDQNRSSWFGWGGAGASAGYERAKNG